MRAQPGATFEATVEGMPANLVGTVGVRIIDLAGGTALARHTTGIVQSVSGSGQYAATMVAPAVAGQYALLWDAGGALTPANVWVEDLFVSPSPIDGIIVAPGGTFKTSFVGAPSGLAGVSVEVVNNQGATTIPLTNVGVVEYPAGSGIYQVTLTMPVGTPAGQYAAVWTAGGAWSPTGSAAEDIWVVTPTIIGSSDSGERIPPSILFCGREVCNPARALNYLRIFNPNGVFHDIDTTGLPQILYRLRGTPETFVNPVTDTAPWYDPAVPASGEFLGVLIDKVTGLGGRTTRSITQTADGSAIGRSYKSGVTLKATGTLVAMTYAGKEYGKRWLIDQLNQTCTDCDVCDLQIRLCAPPDNGSNDELCHWTIPGAALTSGPNYDELPCPEIETFTFEMAAQSAWLYQTVYNCLPETVLWAANLPGGTCVDFDLWFCGIGGPQSSCTITPPNVGIIGTIITIDASDGEVGFLRIGAYNSCPPAPGDAALKSLRIRTLIAGSKLVIDSSRHTITYTGPDGTESDGTPYIDVPEDADSPWFEFDDCSPTTCVAVQVEHQCGGGAFTTVQIDAQLRQE